jgi:hypothetical protein
MARQGNLFDGPAGHGGGGAAAALELSAGLLRSWQQRLAAFQAPLFAAEGAAVAQTNLFSGPDEEPEAQASALNPLRLHPQPLSFWRWPEAPQQGAALYFVIDRPPQLDQPLLLYVGETGAADRRWKGEHDCKRYLLAYGEALSRAGLDGRPSIRFWLDAPRPIKARRALEQALIRRWQPPFNKETRRRWATPFTAEPDGT